MRRQSLLVQKGQHFEFGAHRSERYRALYLTKMGARIFDNYLPTRSVLSLSFASSSWCRNRNCPVRSSPGASACAIVSQALPCRNTWPVRHDLESATIATIPLAFQFHGTPTNTHTYTHDGVSHPLTHNHILGAYQQIKDAKNFRL